MDLRTQALARVALTKAFSVPSMPGRQVALHQVITRNQAAEQVQNVDISNPITASNWLHY